MQINNDSELQNLVNSAHTARHKIKKQMVKEYQIVDGFPILDEYEHLDSAPSRSTYDVDFRMPLKGINKTLISTTLLNACNMFSTLYFMQLVVILESDSIQIPGKRANSNFKTVESQPIMLKLT